MTEVNLPDEYTDDPPGVGVNDPITLRDALRLAVVERDNYFHRLTSVREQRDEAQRERNRLTERVAILEGALGDALDEVERQRQVGLANAALVKDLSTAGNGLGKRLVALTEAVLAAADEHGLRDDAGDA